MFMKIARLIVLSAALVSVSCAAHAQGKPAPKDAVLYFVWPQNGTTIRGGFWGGFGLRDTGGTPPGARFQKRGPPHFLICGYESLHLEGAIPQHTTPLHFGAGQHRRGEG